jgi:hypothetical protein
MSALEPRNVMVAVPYRAGTPSVFVHLTMDHFNALTWKEKRLVLWPNTIAPTPGSKYAPNAEARNQLIERELRDTDEWVLWLDVDLVRVPSNLIEVLYEEGGGQICAPLIFVERVKRGPVNIHNGGWFYDTGAFIKDGRHAKTEEPIFPDYTGGTVQLASVGCCYLIPADVYRMGGRYVAIGDAVEHVALMNTATELGFKVFMTDRARCEHAYLPRYGEQWH